MRPPSIAWGIGSASVADLLSLASLRLHLETEALREWGASIRALREKHLGEAAVKRLAALDAERREWQWGATSAAPSEMPSLPMRHLYGRARGCAPASARRALQWSGAGEVARSGAAGGDPRRPHRGRHFAWLMPFVPSFTAIPPPPVKAGALWTALGSSGEFPTLPVPPRW